MLSRNAQGLKYFAQQAANIPRKRLVKMAYMADIVSRQYLGRPVSEFAWKSYHFGPYADAIPDAVDELTNSGMATVEAKRGAPGEPNWKVMYDAGKATVFAFTAAESEILVHVVRTYLDMPMEELVDDVVYNTEPWKRADRFDEPLPMELSDGAGTREIGFNLEAVRQAERQADEGDFVSARDFFDALRNRIAARHSP